MAVQTLKLAGKKFVVVEEREYQQLKRQAKAAAPSKSRSRHRLTAQDRGDIAEAKRRLADPNQVPIPWEEVRNRLGQRK